MNRSERTQMYIDLGKLSLELEANQHTTKNLVDAMVSNPHSPYYDSAKISFEKLKAIREQLYDKEVDLLMILCGKSNAIEIGTLEVDEKGKVTAHV